MQQEVRRMRIKRRARDFTAVVHAFDDVCQPTDDATQHNRMPTKNLLALYRTTSVPNSSGR
jgi:hypothetical protein